MGWYCNENGGPNRTQTLAARYAVKIRFEVRVEDLVEFTIYYCEHSPSIIRIKRIVQWAVPIVAVSISLAIFVGIIPIVDGAEQIVTFVLALIFAILFSITWVLIWPAQYRNSIARRARRLYQEGSANGAVGTQELELTETDLVSRNSTSESRTRLSAIEKTVTKGDYSYIMLNAFTAHVIPHAEISTGDLTAFLEALERRISVDRA
jgi:hypothetical protein